MAVTRGQDVHVERGDIRSYRERSNIDVSVFGDVLVIRGKKEQNQNKEEKDTNYYVSERSDGSFQRSFRLLDGVDQDKDVATFSKGVLTITSPRTADAQKQQKKIDIKSI